MTTQESTATDPGGDDPDAGASAPTRVSPVRRVDRWLFGTGPVAALTRVHSVHSAAESCFVVSLAGSIFFSVSPDAARPRVLLFLTLTLAPFLLVAPFLDPVVRRVRGGLSATIIVTFVVRAALALAIAQQLRTLALFPLVFASLVTSKAYSIVRNAAVPALVDDADQLVDANARISRTATITGALSASAALALFTVASAEATLVLAAVVHVAGALLTVRVGRINAPSRAAEQVALVELDQPDVSDAVADMMALRAAAGFALFQFGFSLRSAGEPAWVLGAIIAGNSVGAFVGTFLAPVLRRRRPERTMFTVVLIAAATAAAIGGLFFGRVTLLVTIVVLGASVSIGRRALDATIQAQAPDARTAGAYARIETRLELAWVLAACLAVAIRVDSWVGVLVLAGFLAGAAVVHIVRTSRPAHDAAEQTPLDLRLLHRAEVLANHGFHDEAVVIARAVADGRTDVSADTDVGGVDPDEAARHAIDDARAAARARRR